MVWRRRVPYRLCCAIVSATVQRKRDGTCRRFLVSHEMDWRFCSRPCVGLAEVARCHHGPTMGFKECHVNPGNSGACTAVQLVPTMAAVCRPCCPTVCHHASPLAVCGGHASGTTWHTGTRNRHLHVWHPGPA